jgi:membrane protein implicated in regulation of membrane protease activity
MELFKIDLHFWWYYALSFLISCLSSGAMILSLMGVALPVSVEAAEWGFMLLALAAQFGLFLWAKPVMEATWAQAFEQLMADQKRVQEEAEVPKRKLSDFL